MYKKILLILFIIISFNIYAQQPNIDVNSRFVSFGFDDGRTSDFEWVAPMFTQYNSHASFNIINYAAYAAPSYVEKVDSLIAQGHEIGDHTIWHRTFMYVHPFFNGQPEEGYIGGIENKGFPTNADMKDDQGDGKNIFGVLLDQKIKDSHIWYYTQIGLSNPDSVTWGTLTDNDCQAIRNYLSVWNYSSVTGLLDYLDELSAQYCGTIGYSKDSLSWNGEKFTKGIFTGCKTTCNHEIWDRLVEIQHHWYTDTYNLNDPPTNWSFPGGPHSPDLFYLKDGRKYYDRDYTIIANHFGKCQSSKTLKFRSWAGILQDYEYKTVSDAHFEGRWDGCEKRNIILQMPFNANLCKDNNVCRLNYHDKLSFAPVNTYSPDEEPLLSSTNWLKTIYEVDTKFKLMINKLIRKSNNGMIPFGLNDSQDTFTWRLFFDLFLQFCQEAGIEAISMKEAYEIAYNNPVVIGNLFRNPNMRRSVFEVTGANNSPSYPDGWTAGIVDTTNSLTDSTNNILVLDGISSTEFFLYGVPPGILNFSFASKKGSGTSKIIIKKIRNIDLYYNAANNPLIDEININSDNWQFYNTSFYLEDAPRLSVPTELSPSCDGFDNKIVGVYFKIEGQGTHFAMPDLTRTSIPVIIVDLKVFLEGPFNGTDMNTFLNPSDIPLSQPYNNSPWNYSGVENVTQIPNNDIVDWVLIELRETQFPADSANSSTIVARQAAFLLKDGAIKGMDGISPLQFNLLISENLYAVVWHRNHLGVISANAISLIDSVYHYDFSTGYGQVLGGTNGYKEIGNGVWGMIGGDGNANGQTENSDKNDVWEPLSGQTGYLSGDFNMNRQVANPDKNDIWAPNSGKGTQIPDNVLFKGYLCQVPE
ncbi:MAG: polysaccharide deacetylase family protein [Bacteroidales bacterium]|nr:polysaccharide deacetylase family protein [Bacteroidales bacterium]